MKKGEMIALIAITLIAIGCIATSAVACVKYGGQPITEIPAWALIFMFGGGK